MLTRLAAIFVLSAFLLFSCSTAIPTNAEANASLAPATNILTDIVYGHAFGMAMTFDVYIPVNPKWCGVELKQCWRGGAVDKC